MIPRPAWFAGLCPVCGLEVSSPGAESGDHPKIVSELADFTVITSLPSFGRWPVVKHGDPHEFIVSGQDGVAYHVAEGGRAAALGGVFGLQNVGLTHDDKMAWATWLTTYQIAGDETPHTVPLPDGAVRGWSGDPAMARNWYDDQNLHPLVIQGERFFNPSWSPDGMWVVGQHASDWIHLAYHVPTDQMFVAGSTEGSPWAPRLIMLGGDPVIVRSYPSGLIWRSEFVPYVPPPIVVPTFHKTDEKIGIGVFLAPEGMPGLTIANNQAQYPYRPGQSKAVLYTLGQGQEAAALMLGSKVNLPVVGYLDSPGLTAEMLPYGVRAGVYGYPRPNETALQVAERVEEEIVNLQGDGVSCDLVAAAYCQYRGPGDYYLPEQLVLDTLGALWPVVVRRKVGAIWLFAQYRGPIDHPVDGIDYWPNLQESADRLRRASGDWLSFPVRKQPADEGNALWLLLEMFK